MKVVCINDKPDSGQPHPLWNIKKGEIYEIIGKSMTEWGECLVLDGQPDIGYWPEHFAPIYTIDETNKVNHKEATIWQS